MNPTTHQKSECKIGTNASTDASTIILDVRLLSHNARDVPRARKGSRMKSDSLQSNPSVNRVFPGDREHSIAFPNRTDHVEYNGVVRPFQLLWRGHPETAPNSSNPATSSARDSHATRKHAKAQCFAPNARREKRLDLGSATRNATPHDAMHRVAWALGPGSMQEDEFDSLFGASLIY